ncbi:MAG: menaquinone biosynthesis decarboxylase [Halobacteria archaeon]
MAYSDLREFIQVLDEHDELVRVEKEVDPVLEISEITDRVSRKQQKYNNALLFENVVGSDIPVLINALGSYERINLALEVDELDDISRRIEDLLNFRPSGDGGLMGMVKNLDDIKEGIGKAKEFASSPPKTVKRAPCQKTVDYDPDLTDLPILKCWPQDGGRFITLPLVVTSDAEGGRNVGVYRMQVYNDTETGMHWQMHKHGAKHYRDSDEGMEVAVAIGADPATVYSATAPLPFDIDEMMLAGYLRRKRVRLTECKTVDLKVPANSEMILEGHVYPGRERPEGPFGDHTGYYTPVEEFPVFEVDCITTRKNPIYHTTIVGKPPQEDAYLGKATERIFLPLVRTQFEEVVDMNLPVDGVFHNLLIVSMDKQYPGHARQIMMGMFSLGMLSLTKTVIVVDEDVDVHDNSEVTWAVTSRMDPARDVEIIDRAPLDHLEHAAPMTAYGGKMGIDATRPWESEGFEREWPDEIEMDPEVVDMVDKNWGEYGIESQTD